MAGRAAWSGSHLEDDDGAVVGRRRAARKAGEAGVHGLEDLARRAVLQADHVPEHAFLAEPLAAPAPPQRLGHAAGEEPADAPPPLPSLHRILPRPLAETEPRPASSSPVPLPR